MEEEQLPSGQQDIHNTTCRLPGKKEDFYHVYCSESEDSEILETLHAGDQIELLPEEERSPDAWKKWIPIVSVLYRKHKRWKPLTGYIQQTDYLDENITCISPAHERNDVHKKTGS